MDRCGHSGVELFRERESAKSMRRVFFGGGGGRQSLVEAAQGRVLLTGKKRVEWGKDDACLSNAPTAALKPIRDRILMFPPLMHRLFRHHIGPCVLHVCHDLVFAGASKFDGDLRKWDTSSVANMQYSKCGSASRCCDACVFPPISLCFHRARFSTSRLHLCCCIFHDQCFGMR
jgi:surface protein